MQLAGVSELTFAHALEWRNLDTKNNCRQPLAVCGVCLVHNVIIPYNVSFRFDRFDLFSGLFLLCLFFTRDHQLTSQVFLNYSKKNTRGFSCLGSWTSIYVLTLLEIILFMSFAVKSCEPTISGKIAGHASNYSQTTKLRASQVLGTMYITYATAPHTQAKPQAASRCRFVLSSFRDFMVFSRLDFFEHFLF